MPRVGRKPTALHSSLNTLRQQARREHGNVSIIFDCGLSCPCRWISCFRQVASRSRLVLPGCQPCCVSGLCTRQICGQKRQVANPGKHLAPYWPGRWLARRLGGTTSASPQVQEAIISNRVLGHSHSQLLRPCMVLLGLGERDAAFHAGYGMSITPFQALACPLDGTPLHCNGSAWRCASGHSFDIASQGYTQSVAGAKQALARSGRQQGDDRGTAAFSHGRLLPADCRCGEPGRAGRSAR